MSIFIQLAAYLLGRQLADYVDTSIDLKKEQLTHAQMQNEIMRLKMQVAKMEAQKTIEAPEQKMLTLADVPSISREAYPNMTDEEWQADIDNLNRVLFKK